MSIHRPFEDVKSVAVTASLPATDPLDALQEAGSAHIILNGAGLAVFECTAVNGLTVKAEVLTRADGTWRTRKSYQQAANGAPALVAANTAITLVAGDYIFVDTRGFHAVRLKRASGTSATLLCRTAEDAEATIDELNQSAQSTSLAIIDNLVGQEYETVAASQTAQALGATGATGDLINGILVIPATVSPGAVTLLDGATSIPVFVGGASSVSNLVPFYIPLGIRSVSGAWKITTGADVSCIGVGDFT